LRNADLRFKNLEIWQGEEVMDDRYSMIDDRWVVTGLLEGS